MAKGRRFTEEDKALLRTVELELLNRVIPEYRDAAARGQIEMSASPFYHPILPLLCDTDVYMRTHPDSRLPRQAISAGRGRGRPARARGGLSRAAVRSAAGRPVAVGRLGVRRDGAAGRWRGLSAGWRPTSMILGADARARAFRATAAAMLEQPERLYTPYRVRAGGADVACVFRDHVLSDLIGFAYAGWDADAAAGDFVGRLVEAAGASPNGPAGERR